MLSLTLHLPVDYVIPAIYQSTSSEVNAIVLNAGVQVIEAIRRSDIESRLKEKDKRLGELLDITTVIKTHVESSIAVLKEPLGTLCASVLATERQGREESEVRLNALEQRVVAERTRLGSIVTTTMEMLAKSSVAQEALSSSRKGSVNEDKSKQLIIDTFGTPGTGFTMLPKEYHKGDHVFDWQSFRVMWEDKDYGKVVSQDEINKAFRDFNEHQDCEVLLIVSANTFIKGHETSAIDLDVVEGRLIIYVSNFRKNIDVYAYVKTIIQPIIVAVGGVLRRVKAGDSMEYYVGKIDVFKALMPVLSRHIVERTRLLRSLLKEIKKQFQIIENADAEASATLQTIMQVLLEEPDAGTPRRAEPAEEFMEFDDDGDRAINGRATLTLDDAYTSPLMEPKRRGQRQCSKCGGFGHIAKTCGTRR